MHESSEMFREWKSAKRIHKDTIAPEKFNIGYDKGYKEWSKKNIQNSSFQTPLSFLRVTNREDKEVVELQDLKEEEK